MLGNWTVRQFQGDHYDFFDDKMIELGMKIDKSIQFRILKLSETKASGWKMKSKWQSMKCGYFNGLHIRNTILECEVTYSYIHRVSRWTQEREAITKKTTLRVVKEAGELLIIASDRLENEEESPILERQMAIFHQRVR